MDLWLLYGLLAAIFAALTTIFSKIGITCVGSHLATAIRTSVVLIFAWFMVFLTGTYSQINYINLTTWFFILLSGLATGGSWIFFFLALKIGTVSKVVPIDKSSIILTMLLSFIFLGEAVNPFMLIGMILIGLGTWLMIDLQKNPNKNNCQIQLYPNNFKIVTFLKLFSPSKVVAKTLKLKGFQSCSAITPTKNLWLVYAVLAAVFASLTAIFGKIGVTNIDATLFTATRTIIVLPLSLLMVYLSKDTVTKSYKITSISTKSWIFLILSGMATGASWLFFYHALQLGNASHVVPIDRLSILFTMIFAKVFLKETFTKRSLLGLLLLTCGIFATLIT